jgi:proteasome lid subunit RPN8/RPN11
MAVTEKGPDIGMLNQEKLANGAFPGDTATGFRIFVDPAAQKDIDRHAREDTSVEICGVLVGVWKRDERGPFVNITNSIRGEAATNKLAEVTFTHETWAKINSRMDKEFTDKSIVGWYHTHPDFGIFLSDRDRFIHENFFSGPGQVAYVVDPVRKEDGMFHWVKGKPKRSPYFWVGSEFRIASDTSDERNLRKEERGMSANSATTSREAPAKKEEADPPPAAPMSSTMMLVLVGALMFLLGYYLQGRMLAWEQTRLVEGTVFHYGTIKGMNLGLPKDLGDLSTNILAIQSEVLRLGQDQLAKNPDADVKTAFQQLLDHMQVARTQADTIKDRYTLTPEETAAYQKYLNARVLAAAGQGGDMHVENPADPPVLPAAPTTAPATGAPAASAATPATQATVKH